jgi:hypothetical protein
MLLISVKIYQKSLIQLAIGVCYGNLAFIVQMIIEKNNRNSFKGIFFLSLPLRTLILLGIIFDMNIYAIYVNQLLNNRNYCSLTFNKWHASKPMYLFIKISLFLVLCKEKLIF